MQGHYPSISAFPPVYPPQHPQQQQGGFPPPAPPQVAPPQVAPPYGQQPYAQQPYAQQQQQVPYASLPQQQPYQAAANATALRPYPHMSPVSTHQQQQQYHHQQQQPPYGGQQQFQQQQQQPYGQQPQSPYAQQQPPSPYGQQQQPPLYCQHQQQPHAYAQQHGASFGSSSGGSVTGGNYPPVPQPLPVMPFSAPPDKVPYGYDVMVYIQRATNLPGMDWWNGQADPYVIVTTCAPSGEQIVYRSKTVFKCLNPSFDEFFEVSNLPGGSYLMVEVWDKDVVTDDDIIGRAAWTFAPKELLPSATAGGGWLGGDDSWGRLPVQLKLRHPSKAHKGMGDIEIEVSYRPSRRPGQPAMMGPVRFRQHLSPTAGMLTGHWASADAMSFSTYKLSLMHIEAVFKGVKQPWNRDYDKAVSIFKNPLMLGTVRTQHASLYSTALGRSRCGVLTSCDDFFGLFSLGVRGGQRRYFTYTLLEDSLRCSETGAAFFSDMMSKHAMHAGGEEEVLYAGEFCIVPQPGAPGGHRLVIDNNSGTYAPKSGQLGLMAQLFTANFPDMVVEVVPVGDPRLAAYQQQCPSRATA